MHRRETTLKRFHRLMQKRAELHKPSGWYCAKELDEVERIDKKFWEFVDKYMYRFPVSQVHEQSQGYPEELWPFT